MSNLLFMMMDEHTSLGLRIMLMILGLFLIFVVLASISFIMYGAIYALIYLNDIASNYLL